MPKINDLFGMMNSLKMDDSKENKEDIKKKLSGMLSGFGLDMNKITQDIENSVNQIKENESKKPKEDDMD
jgi:hypothetical protein